MKFLQSKEKITMKLGTDVVHIVRLKNMPNIQGFVKKICTTQEQTYIQEKTGHSSNGVVFPYATAAGLFAAKETVLKAMGTGVSGGAGLLDVEVLHSPAGKPYIRLHGKTLQNFMSQGLQSIEISISHDGEYAFAVCCIE